MGFFDAPSFDFDLDNPFSEENLHLLNDPGDLSGQAATTAAQEAAAAAGDMQQLALLQAAEKTKRARAEAQRFLEPYGGVGQAGVDQAGFLTDPQAQYDFLQNNPLFAASLENANTGTMNLAASKGRISAGDTLQQLSNNVLLSAAPLIAGQKQSIGDLLNVGTGVARSQANTAIGKGSELSSLIQSGGNVGASTLLAQNQIAQQNSANNQQLAGTVLSFMASDPKLKTNKKRIGARKGFTIWSWDWNEVAQKVFGLTGSSVGVMADEVKEKMPEAVLMRDGYMTVDYEMIGVPHG